MTSIPATSPRTAQNSNWVLIGRLLQLGWRYRWGCIYVLCLQMVMLAIGLSGLSLTGLGIDYIRFRVDPAAKIPHFPFGIHPPADAPVLGVVAFIAIAILALALARGALTYFYTLAANRLVQSRIVVYLRSQVYNKLQRLSFRFFDANETGSIINRVTSDAQNVRLFVDGVMIQTVILLLSLTIYISYMLSIHAKLTLVCLASTPILWVASTVFSKSVRPQYDKNRKAADQMILTLSENIQGVHVVKGFARDREEIQKFAVANDRVTNQQRSIFFRVSLFTPAIMFLTYFNLVLLLGYGGYLLLHDQLTLGTLVVFAGLLGQFSTQVNNVAAITNSIQQSLSGAKRVFEILDAPMEIQSLPDATRMPRSGGRVRFESVSFSYKAGEVALRDISLEAEPGQCVAILGGTGAGKSTLLSLIPRFYDPDSGRVLVDGVDVRYLMLDDLRRNIGIVFQESFLFSNTIAANIAFGHPDASREQVEAAAKIAKAHDFIMAMAKGYDTVLGEGGSTLSGGQRQRLAIARSLLLNPSILLLDDPTAAIDSQTEHEIMTAMESAMEGRTTFVVANRLSTLRRADYIIVMERGRIVEVGTHDQLMLRKGRYLETAKLQVADEESLILLEQVRTRTKTANVSPIASATSPVSAPAAIVGGGHG